MYLSEALTKLKNLKSKAKRIDVYISASVVYYEDAEPEYVFLEECANRDEIQAEILNLKSKIIKTNANTLVNYNNQSISLTKVILLNAQARIQLAFLSGLQALEKSGHSYVSRTREEIKKVYAVGYDKTNIKISIDAVEQKKEVLESIMANANANTPLVED